MTRILRAGTVRVFVQPRSQIHYRKRTYFIRNYKLQYKNSVCPRVGVFCDLQVMKMYQFKI